MYLILQELIQQAKIYGYYEDFEAYFRKFENTLSRYGKGINKKIVEKMKMEVLLI